MAESGSTKFGILFKMVIIFLAITFIPMVTLMLISLKQMYDIQEMSISTSADSLEDLGKKIIELQSRAVARNLEIYLTTQPENIQTRKLLGEPEFIRIASQKVGELGRTELYEQRTMKFLIYPDEQYIGTSILDTRDKFPEIVGILEQCGPGKPSDGFYSFADANGKSRKKYLFATPVGERFIVAASTFMDEFSAPSKELEHEINRKSKKNMANFGIVIAIFTAIVAILAIVTAGAITRPIKYLINAANSISMGDLDFKIEVKSKDEIGQLANAVARLQESLIAAIDRLKRKKE